MKRYLLGILAALAISSCDEGTTLRRQYVPVDGVTVIIETRTLEKWEDKRLVALYFDMTIVNESGRETFIEPEKIATTLNGVGSEKTYYATLADYDGNYVPQELPQGSKVFHLYSIYPPAAWSGKLEAFEMTDFGVAFGEVPHLE